jgi:acetyl esterase
MKIIKFIVVLFLVFNIQILAGQETITYKTIDTLSLKMEVFYPDNINPMEKYPAIVFFFWWGMEWRFYQAI